MYSSIQSRLFVYFCAIVFVFGFFQIGSAFAVDMQATNAFPTADTEFYTTDNVTFIGSVDNIAAGEIPEAGYADVEIDWGRDGSFDNFNAYPGSDSMVGRLTVGGSFGLQEIYSNPPIGSHRYRFSIDTTNVATESDETNNRSAWVNFTVIDNPTAPVVTFGASSNPIVSGDTTSLTWTVTGATSCTASGGWSGSKNSMGGSETVSPLTTTLYTLTCEGDGGTSFKNFTVDVVAPAPTVSLLVSSSSIIVGGSTSLTWTASNATACVASNGWSGSKDTSGGSESVTVSGPTTYILTCTGVGGTTTVSRSVAVSYIVPVITFTASPYTVASGGITRLTWSAVGATYCAATGWWSGSKNPNGGSQNVSPVTPAVYNLACSNPGAGTSTAVVTIAISGAPDLTTPIYQPGGWWNHRMINSVNPSSTRPLVVGEANTFLAKAANIGSASTVAGYTSRFRVSLGWNISTIYGLRVNPALAAAATTSPDESTTFIPTSSGHAEVEYCPDITGVINESNETNNCTWRQYDIQGLPNSPNLTMSLDNGNPSSWIVGTSTVYTSNNIYIGATSTISWVSTNSTQCVGYKNGAALPQWSSVKYPANGTTTIRGSLTVSPSDSMTNYAMQCIGPNGTTTKAVRINIQQIQPQVTFTTSNNLVLRGSPVTLSWQVVSAHTCVGSSSPSDSSWNGTKSRSTGTQVVNPAANTTYILTCDSTVGTTKRNIQIDVYDPIPTITLSATPNPITPIDTATLTWSATDATSCTASGGWSGSKNAVGGSESVSPDTTTLYSLSCSGPGGTSLTDFTISVAETPPSITLSLDKTIAIEDESTNIHWDVLGATSCIASNGWSGVRSVSGGSEQVSPSDDAKFVLECAGPWGTTIRDITLYVIPRADIEYLELCDSGGGNCIDESDVMIYMNPSTPITLRWKAQDAGFCSAVSGKDFSTIGSVEGTDVALAGALPNRSYTYAVVCGTAGILTATKSITIHTNLVIPEIWIEPKVLGPEGGNAVVYWDTHNGDQSVCSISGGGLTDSMLTDDAYKTSSSTGQVAVSLTGKTTMQVQCGDEKDSVVFEVSPRIWGR